MPRKIILDQVDYVFTPSKRKKIKTILILSGGGTLQSFFALGAVACLVDNGLFDFDVISAISGGALLLTFIDLCTNPDWYNLYVRKNMYIIARSKSFAYLIRSGFDLQKHKIIFLRIYKTLIRC